MDAVDILLMSGDLGDVVVTRDEFEHFKVANSVRVIADGADALRILRRQPPFQDAATPDLILLDVDLPGKRDSRAVLAELRADQNLRDVPVVLLTGSGDEAAARRFAPGASAYAAKPVDFDELAEIVLQLDGLALAVVRRERIPL